MRPSGPLLVLTAMVAGDAIANPEPPALSELLDVTPPVSMAMRQSETAAEPEPVEPGPVTADDLPVDPSQEDRFLDFGSRADRPDPPTLEEKLIFRFNLGFGLDGGETNCADGVCTSPPSGIDGREFDDLYFSSLRSYGFGDAVIGTRGVGAASLNTYFAANFRFDQSGVVSSAVPSIHDASAVDPVLVRAGFVETDGFFRHPRLRPIYVRAGRQFRYGAAIAHFDGLSMGYDSRAVSLSFFSGTRVSMYGFDPGLIAQRGLISGVDARVDIYELKRVPLVLSGSMLFFDEAAHFEGGLALKWSRDSVVRASTRISARNFNSQRLSLRTRVSRRTTMSAEIESQSSLDWPYDLLLGSVEGYDATDPRRYLDFGFQLPRVYMNVRGGTVLIDNIDLLVRMGAAIDRNNRVVGADADSASYLEGGLAFEVRLRRALALGASSMVRGYSRQEPTMATNTAGADELPSQFGPIGERSFAEGGVSVRFEPGRKAFTASAELYGRLYDWQSPYIEREDELELRGGGRFSVDGWANERTRMRLEYDVAFAPEMLAPELRSVKTLRVMMEGTF